MSNYPWVWFGVIPSTAWVVGSVLEGRKMLLFVFVILLVIVVINVVMVVVVTMQALSSFIICLFVFLLFIYSSWIICLIIFCLFIASLFISAITDLRSVPPGPHADTIQVACLTGRPITPAPPLPLPSPSLLYCMRLIVGLVDPSVRQSVSQLITISPSLGHCRRERDLSAPRDILVARVISRATFSTSAIFVVCLLVIIVIVVVVINVVVVVVIITRGWLLCHSTSTGIFDKPIRWFESYTPTTTPTPQTSYKTCRKRCHHHCCSCRRHCYCCCHHCCLRRCHLVIIVIIFSSSYSS